MALVLTLAVFNMFLYKELGIRLLYTFVIFLMNKRPRQVTQIGFKVSTHYLILRKRRGKRMRLRNAMIALLSTSGAFLFALTQQNISSIVNSGSSKFFLSIVNGFAGNGSAVGSFNPVLNTAISVFTLANPVLYGIILYQDYRRLKSDL